MRQFLGGKLVLTSRGNGKGGLSCAKRREERNRMGRAKKTEEDD